ncbi:MAG: hypothetical protein K5657_04465 [Desulfovibrio sp.]|nr:hypothetical protein [Desulfovibrio sp.]
MYYSLIANVPKEKRNVIYTALTAFNQPVKNASEARQKNSDEASRTWISCSNAPVFIARLLKNFNKAESMYQSGTLPPKNIIKEFFNEIPNKGNYDYKTINDYFQKIDNDLSLLEEEGGQYEDLNGVVLAMQNSGATFDETVLALRSISVPAPLTCQVSSGQPPVDANFCKTISRVPISVTIKTETVFLNLIPMTGSVSRSPVKTDSSQAAASRGAGEYSARLRQGHRIVRSRTCNSGEHRDDAFAVGSFKFTWRNSSVQGQLQRAFPG